MEGHSEQRYDVLTAVSMNIIIVWDVTLFHC
jgi:hypothetical protein